MTKVELKVKLISSAFEGGIIFSVNRFYDGELYLSNSFRTADEALNFKVEAIEEYKRIISSNEKSFYLNIES